MVITVHTVFWLLLFTFTLRHGENPRTAAAQLWQHSSAMAQVLIKHTGSPPVTSYGQPSQFSAGKCCSRIL
ncbi:hypothetical protein V1525DRAFT_402048 [Lipomyces kononenkoae]|uniref:Uncharacterized protein n=1 Tax=Lipomyces kononenkoae TaxID=34357 RepID=A0ACC3T2I0_LIPKO